MSGPRSHERKPGKQGGRIYPLPFPLVRVDPKTPKAKGRPRRRRENFL